MILENKIIILKNNLTIKIQMDNFKIIRQIIVFNNITINVIK